MRFLRMSVIRSPPRAAAALALVSGVLLSSYAWEAACNHRRS